MKAVKKTATRKGSKYICTVCGLTLTVERDCGCAEMHPVICCGKEMQIKQKKIAKK
ncbi:MAG: hypothetical protein ACUVUH_03860 [bacterium]